ncbi:MAG: alkaline phosphatase [Spirochaetales bacterium]|nr:alkaline phosphatase [Spirochaetales bacterium]
MKQMAAALLALLVSINLYGEGQKDTIGSADSSADTQAKYVFLFIGDGMSLTQINAAEAYLKAGKSGEIGVEKLAFTQFPAQGLTTTYDAGSFITDSASAGTAIASGNKTLSGVINMDVTKTQKFTTIAELAKDAGMKVGILSSVNLDHATPASFYAKEETRNNYYNIGVQMANSDFDYYAGGLIRTTKTPDGQTPVLDIMKNNGWSIATTRDELNSLKPSSNQVYAYYNTSLTTNSLDYALDMEADDITLAEYTKKGIELLDNENGFFMMVEGGKIDWACHANDAAASISNTIAFDKAIQEAMAFYNQHPEETLIIVTGDHETGGLSLGFAGTGYDSAFTEISKQKMSYEAFDKYVAGPFKSENPEGTLAQLMPAIEENFGLTDFSDYESGLLNKAFNAMMNGAGQDEESYILYGGYNPLSVTLTHILNNRAGLAWTSYSHTGVPVATFAMGVGSDMYNGYYDNTDIFKKTSALMAVAP